jgi:hypothetical protein
MVDARFGQEAITIDAPAKRRSVAEFLLGEVPCSMRRSSDGGVRRRSRPRKPELIDVASVIEWARGGEERFLKLRL